jgi:hypothetical protein
VDERGDIALGEDREYCAPYNNTIQQCSSHASQHHPGCMLTTGGGVSDVLHLNESRSDGYRLQYEYSTKYCTC